MFKGENCPIFVTYPDWEKAIVYFLHDLHYGSAQFNLKKWNALKKEIKENDCALVCWLGDLMENAIPGSKGDVFEQTASPAQQKEWVTQQIIELKDKTICVLPGNHEYNRTTKFCGIYPIYDICLEAGISDKYRNNYAFIDIGVGKSNKCTPVRYAGQLQHRSKDIKSVCSADYTDGIDFFVSGHDHEPKDKPRAKLYYNPQSKIVYRRSIEYINCGSFLDYGGYGARGAFRPQSDKLYTLRLDGHNKSMETRGFYV